MKFRATIKTIKILVLILFLTTISSYAYTSTSRFNVIKDVWISAYKGEENFNMGATSKLKLKVELSPSYEDAHMQLGAVKIKIFVKENLLAYDVYIDGEEVPSWKIPRPGPSGSIQEIALDWLPPEEIININILP